MVATTPRACIRSMPRETSPRSAPHTACGTAWRSRPPRSPLTTSSPRSRRLLGHTCPSAKPSNSWSRRHRTLTSLTTPSAAPRPRRCNAPAACWSSAWMARASRCAKPTWPKPNTRVTSRKLIFPVSQTARTRRAAGLSCGGSGVCTKVEASPGRCALCHSRIQPPAAAQCRDASACPTGSAHRD